MDRRAIDWWRRPSQREQLLRRRQRGSPTPRGLPSARGLPMALLTLWILALAGAQSPVRADSFELDDGRTLEGNIVREIGSLLCIRLEDGKVVTIDRSHVVRRTARRTAYDEYRDRLAATDTEVADQQCALAQWCADRGLGDLALRHYKETIRLAPHHEVARKALGYVRIGGDWFIAGSPEARARREHIERPLERAPREIPRKPGTAPTKPASPPSPTTVPVGATRVDFIADEVVGDAPPETSLTQYLLAQLLAGLQPAHVLHPRSKADAQEDGLVLEVRIRVYFVRTHMFYKRVPIVNVFRGEASARLYRMNAGVREEIVRIRRFDVPFSAGTQTPKKEAFGYAYGETVRSLTARLSRTAYFRKRGAKPLPDPLAAELGAPLVQ